MEEETVLIYSIICREVNHYYMHGNNKALFIAAPVLALATILMLNTISSHFMHVSYTEDERSLKAPSGEEKEGDASIASREEGLQAQFAYTEPRETGAEHVNNILPYVIGVVSAFTIFVILRRSYINKPEI